MTTERIIGARQIAKRISDDAATQNPNSRHVFPDSSFMLFGPFDCGGIKIKTSQKIAK